MLIEKRFNAARGAALRIADQHRVFQGAGQIKIIDRTEADADLAARSIDVGDAFDRCIFAYKICTLDEQIGCSEVYVRRTRRFDGDETDVPGVLHRAIEGFSGRRIDHEFDWNTETLGERRGKLGRDAGWFAVWAFLYQHRIAEIHRGAQLARRRQILKYVGRGRRLRDGDAGRRKDAE